MPIKKEYYEREINRANILMNARLSNETAEAIFREIRADYEDVDLLWALKSVAETGRLDYHNLKKALNAAACIRREKETNAAKAREEKDTRDFFSGRAWANKARGECDYNCVPCPIRECPKMATDAVICINALCDKKRTLEQCNQYMASKYKGWPFDK